MKRISSILSLSLALFFVLLTSCTGPEGPAGPPGKDGKDGAPGTAVCGVCHESSSFLLAKQLQFHNSLHFTGEAFATANRTTCATCHTHEGFRESLTTNLDTALAPIPHPTGVNCRTCHNIHTKYDTTDYALTYTAPVKFRHGGQTVDFGTGNLCAKCHQARIVSPMPAVGGDSITISNFRWGPHYSMNANILAGVGGYEIQGPNPYPTSNPHKTQIKDGCISCHMARPYGTFAGGHTFKMTYESGGQEFEHVVSCAQSNCHPGATKFDIDGKVKEIKDLISQLRQKLIDKGLLDVSRNTTGNDVLNEYIMLPGNKPKKFSSLEAGAVLNYLLVAKDRSYGIHNYKYTKALLVNTLNALQ
ncbi:MAG: hypothetical protein N2560_05695 [Ignavibacteria bacterium]|nr:hypothetical protein [Ignavibacteria bacterium]